MGTFRANLEWVNSRFALLHPSSLSSIVSHSAEPCPLIVLDVAHHRPVHRRRRCISSPCQLPHVSRAPLLSTFVSFDPCSFASCTSSNPLPTAPRRSFPHSIQPVDVLIPLSVQTTVFPVRIPPLPTLDSTLSSSTRSRADEDFINRSLLDSLDAQADAEPVSSSDSEAVGPRSISSSKGSPTVPFHLNMPPNTRSDSPNMLQNNEQSPHIKDPFLHSLPTSAHHSVYNTSHLPTDFTPAEPNSRKQLVKASSFTSDRTIPFGFFNGESRHTPPAPVNNYAPTFPTANSDLFLPSSQQIDAHHTSQSHFDMFGGIRPGLSYEHRPDHPFLDGDGTINDSGSGSALHSSGMLPSLPQSISQQYPQAPYLNGLAHMQSQTPYGPHLPSTSATVPMHSVGGTVTNPTQVEEISTIFVVGFPDDMQVRCLVYLCRHPSLKLSQEREFQNMFTFSSGFEAATLKIPNKESTSYSAPGTTGVRSGGYPQNFSDQYNIAGLSENARDGVPSSWPTEDSHFPPSVSQPPRKQIIGFAKFRTRQEALEARDILQGKRVDAEKNAVLKAEMAKKNLHTKRGPVGVNTNLPPIMTSGSAGGIVDSLTSPSSVHHSEPLTTRDRELGAIGAMGLGSRRDRLGDYADNEDMDRTMVAVRGARSRVDEDERERFRRRQESDASQIRSAAYDAFHSVPPQVSKSPTQNLSSISGGLPGSSHDSIGPLGSNVWGMTAKEVNRRLPIRVALPDLSTHITSPQASPPKSTGLPSSAHSVESDGSSGIHHIDTLSPPSSTFVLPQQPPFGLRSRPYSPPSLDSNQPLSSASSLPSSQSSSEDGNGTAENDLVKDLGSMSVGSPNSSSPTSAGMILGSSPATTRGNPGDQNPPINTLYVGNLPSSPPPVGYSPSYLEDELRELFGRHPGFRKLCFRQKNNGPMCFVEVYIFHLFRSHISKVQYSLRTYAMQPRRFMSCREIH